MDAIFMQLRAEKIKNLLFQQPVDWYLWAVIQLTVMVTVLHYLTPTHFHHLHELYRRLYYFPIIIAAYRYGFNGGIATGPRDPGGAHCDYRTLVAR